MEDWDETDTKMDWCAGISRACIAPAWSGRNDDTWSSKAFVEAADWAKMELVLIKRELAEIRMERDLQIKSSVQFYEGVTVKYGWMGELR